MGAAPHDLAPGRLVGEYRIEATLGKGGFGCVYRAVHPVIGKPAAIKVLDQRFSSDPQMVSRFISEARAVNQIRHRNIIDIFSFGRLEDGRQYYVMELLEGTALDAYLRNKGRLTLAEALPILRQVARALDAAHAHGVYHRDLKPENVFLILDEEAEPFAKLLDFGLAKLLGNQGLAVHATRAGTPMGTPCYMSPEQCYGEQVDHRTDIYSFGVLTFECLTGRLPFYGATIMDVLVQQATAEPPIPSQVCSRLPACCDAPILKMLEKSPAKRPNSATAALDALAIAAGFPESQKTTPLPEKGSGGTTVHIVPAPAEPPSAEAETMSDNAVQLVAAPTLVAAQAPVISNAPTILRRALAGAGAAVLVATLAVFLTLRWKPPSAAAHAALISSPAVASLSLNPGSVAASASIAPVSPTVSLSIVSVPEAVEVYLGEDKLGVAPGPVHLKRGTDKVKLTFKARGYTATRAEVIPAADGTVAVTLAKVGPSVSPARGAPGKKPGGGDLENPF